MRNPTVSKRYAKALFELAGSNNTIDDVLMGLSNVCSSLKQSKEFERVLFNPLIKSEAKEKLVNAITSNKVVLKLISILNKRRRLPLLVEVYEKLSEMSDISKGIHHALVKSAIALSQDEKNRVEQRLQDVFGGKVIGHFDVEQDLIGGIWIESAGKVLDATVKGRIDTFRHALLHSAN